jgi:hypothetical protein
MVRCTGRQVRRFDNLPTGPACAAVYPGPAESARVLGWRIGPVAPDGDRPAMCPACARPGAYDEEIAGAGVLEPLPGL